MALFRQVDIPPSFWSWLLVTALSKSMVGLTGDKDALVIKDLLSNLKQFCPVKSRSLHDTMGALQFFKGSYNIRTMYSDNSGEIIKACKRLGILRESSRPG
eukprot:12044809-Heterocapsa_arctica.AAC.1